MLALSSATVGDICVRTDLSETFILSASPPSTLANWTQLLQPASAVTSVNSLTGSVTLTTTNIAEGTNLYYTTARANAAALATNLTGFSSATGGAVTSGDTILSALGKLENRVALDDAKLTGADRVKLDGSTAMTGMLNFSGTGHAGLQLNNLTDTQRAALTALDGMLIYNTTLSAVQYYNGAWLTLGIGATSGWFNGTGAPSATIGNNGDYYLNTTNGSIYQKSSGAWSVIYAYGATLGGKLTFSPLLTPSIDFGNSWTINQIASNVMTWNWGVVQALTLSEASPTEVDVTVLNGKLIIYDGLYDAFTPNRQLVTFRQTGWTAPTGTISRAPLNTGTATLANVAQTLGALLTDLMTHGLIGT